MTPRYLVDKDHRSRKTYWCQFQNIGHPEDANSVFLRDIAPYLPNYTGKGKGKVTLEMATKAQRGCVGIDLLFL
jgi:hypothetical protein